MYFPSELLVIVSLISPILSDCLQKTAYGNWSVTVSTYRAYGIGDKYKTLFNLTDALSTYCQYKSDCNINIDRVMNLKREFYQETFKKIVQWHLRKYQLDHTVVTYLPFHEKIYPLLLSDEEFQKGFFINKTYDIIYLWNTDMLVFCYDSAAIESVLNTKKSTHYVTFWIRGWSITLQRHEEKMWSSWKTNQDYVFLDNGTQCGESMPFSKLASLITPDLPDASPGCDANPENFEWSELNTKRYNGSVVSESPIEPSEPSVFAIISMVFCGIGFLIILFFIWKRLRSYSFYLQCCRKAEQEPDPRQSSFVKPIIKNDLLSTLDVRPLEVHKYYDVGNIKVKYYDLQGNRIRVQVNEQNPFTPQYDYAYGHAIRPNISETK
ncbi:uncharacterized protein LOC114332309 isoform X2 [Diabrotica virgifera virgifera]|uniref:Uncharacterized protein LOC114332309 isoform X3 n=1 Tax=Diabrotica virgifera virgifera TaxID=50390 RepID=A0A6P7FNK0_DIAVI|nr:uncharacterized protein LOC114332309 isoform X2 [Diabrotica virgifera virgifera]